MCEEPKPNIRVGYLPEYALEGFTAMVKKTRLIGIKEEAEVTEHKYMKRRRGAFVWE